MANLPSGTVTFLVTDIEGSTERWERDRTAMAEAVARHLALLDAAIETHGGIHFKTVGDAVQAAFPSAPDAVAAAVDGQRALVSEEWGEIGPLRVRMALHAGEAAPDAKGDYLAAPLNRLSRLLNAAHGGQILLSQTVQQLTRGALPPGAEARDLGEHRLRDLLEPERVFHLGHPDLPSDFPPLKTLESRPNNLPRQPTPFLGREEEVREVVASLRGEEVQLLTLTGPGGTGKTRLALQAAADLIEDFGDGVSVVHLASLSDPDLVLSTIAAALGIREESGQPVQARLREYLATKQLLLVLDNVEHVIDAAPAVGELLQATPQLKVLATSRVPLRLRAEHEYLVPPLGLPRRKPPPTPEQVSQYEAVRLFIDRAQAVKPGFAVDNATAPIVAEICHRLDGLPLAIELAAARIRLLPPAALLARLEKRLPFLTGGARDAPQRQRTLRDTIDWSHELLGEDEQALFRRLAVFAGGATFAAIEAVANPGGELDILTSLERLIEHSLVIQESGPDAEPRFVMLETIREFGLERLDASGESDQARRDHAEFFLALAEEAPHGLHGSRQLDWLERLDAEHDNLRAALGWTLTNEPVMAVRLVAALYWFWFYRGHLSEGRDWTDRALATGASAPPAVQAQVLNWSSAFAWGRADYETAAPRAEAALELARSAGDAAAEGWALINLGVVASVRGSPRRGAELSAEAEERFITGGDRFGAAAATYNQGLASGSTGDVDRRRLLERSLAESRAIGDRIQASWTLSALGRHELARGNPDRAQGFLEEALAIAREFRFDMIEGSALRGLAEVASKQGDIERMRTLLAEAESKYRDYGHSLYLAGALKSIGELTLTHGDTRRAYALLAEASRLADRSQSGSPQSGSESG